MTNMTEEERFLHRVRLLQRRTKCSNNVCEEFVRVFNMYNKSTGRSLGSWDAKAKKAAGVDYIVLHGCPKCHKYIYTPKDHNINCPFVTEDGTVCGHTRYDAENKPWEVSLLFLYCCRWILLQLLLSFAVGVLLPVA